MKMKEVFQIAARWGIPFKVGISKEDLIRSIQIEEGYSDCFRRAASCEEKECLWKEDCLPAPKKVKKK